MINEQANALFEEIEGFKKDHGGLKNRGLKELQKQIEHLEFRQQTEVISTDKERELIEKIKQMKEMMREQEAELEQNKEVKVKVMSARELRRQASEMHAKVTEMAERAQNHHDLMVEFYRKADKSREDADASHRSFVEAQEAADAEHKYFIACQKELRDYDKVISGLRKKTKKAKVSKEQKAVRKEAEHVYKMFRAGRNSRPIYLSSSAQNLFNFIFNPFFRSNNLIDDRDFYCDADRADTGSLCRSR